MNTPKKTPDGDKKRAFPTFRNLGRGLVTAARRARRPLFFLLVFAIVVYCGFSVYATVLLNRELAELRASGAPMTYAELAPPAIPESEDAARLYTQATAELTAFKRKFPDWHKGPRNSGNSEERYESLAAKNAPVIALLRQAAKRPHFRTAIDWNGNPSQFLFAQHARLREFARLMAAQARLDARAGKIDAALEDIQVIHAMAGHLKEEPTLIAFLVARAISSVGDRTLDEVIRIHPVARAQGRAFQAGLPTVDWIKMFHRSLQGERCFSLWAYENARHDPENFFGPTDIRQRWYLRGPLRYLWSPVFKMDEVFGLRVWKRYMAKPNLLQVPLPYNSGIGMDGMLRKVPDYAVITKILYPIMDSARRTLDDQVTKDRQREAVLALSAYQAVHGAYPAQLKAAESLWGRPLPTDPYNGQMFGYKVTGDNFLLYSVGHNRKDDTSRYTRGTARPAATYEDDIPWIKQRATR